MSNELKLCPFCGSDEVFSYEDYDATIVYCRSCLVTIRTATDEEINSIKRWNTRPIEDALREELYSLQLKIDLEENKTLRSLLDEICVERDALRAHLQIAVEQFKRIDNAPRGMVGEDWFKMVAREALRQINE